jgi:hypothetical protein
MTTPTSLPCPRNYLRTSEVSTASTIRKRGTRFQSATRSAAARRRGVEEVPIDSLRPDPANPRRISEDELDTLERSLRQFGFVQPVLARREDRTVIGGHQRLVAARPGRHLRGRARPPAQQRGRGTIRIEGLRHAAFFWEIRAIGAEAELARRTRSRAGRSASSLTDRRQAWREGSTGLVTGIYAAEEARTLLERRYIDGHPALFPDAIEDRQRLRESAERLASLGGAFPPPPVGRRRAPRSAEIQPAGLDLGALRSGSRAQAPPLAAQLVDGARAATFDVLGDAEGATSLSARRLRATVSNDAGPG